MAIGKQAREPDPAELWLRDRLAGYRGLHALSVASGALQIVALLFQSFFLSQILHSLVIEGRFPDSGLAMLLGIGAMALLRAVFLALKEEFGNKASSSFRLRLREELFDAVHRCGPAWTSQQEAGDIRSRLIEQVDNFDDYLARYLPQRMLAGIGPLLVLVAVFPQNWACALLLFVTAPLIPFFMALVGWGTRLEQEKQLETLSRMSGRFLGLLRGLPSLQAIMAHRRQEAVVEETGQEFRERSIKVLRLGFLSSAVLEFFTMLSIALVAIYLGFSFLGIFKFGTWDGGIALSQAMFILLVAPEFFQPLRDLGSYYHAQSDALAAAGQLREISQAAERLGGGGPGEEPVLGGSPGSASDSGTSSAAREPGEEPVLGGGRVVGELGSDLGAGSGFASDFGAALRGEAAALLRSPGIEMANVSFSYPGGIAVLKDFNLNLGAGETLVITGPSGCGKTTISQILLAHLRADQGEIRVGGRALESMAADEWREHIGWMGQHPVLLSGSLRENLLLARQDATDEEIVEALSQAELGSWFRGLQNGLETRLGEGARPVSGGQLRRLALARLLLRPASFLILDEPTAGLDPENAELVSSRVEEIRKGRTMLVMSHRKEVFGLADRIIELEALPARDAGLGERT